MIDMASGSGSITKHPIAKTKLGLVMASLERRYTNLWGIDFIS